MRFYYNYVLWRFSMLPIYFISNYVETKEQKIAGCIYWNGITNKICRLSNPSVYDSHHEKIIQHEVNASEHIYPKTKKNATRFVRCQYFR